MRIYKNYQKIYLTTELKEKFIKQQVPRIKIPWRRGDWTERKYVSIEMFVPLFEVSVDPRGSTDPLFAQEDLRYEERTSGVSFQSWSIKVRV